MTYRDAVIRGAPGKTCLSVLLILLPVTLFFISFLVGRYAISPYDVVIAVISGILHTGTGLSGDLYTIIFNIRMPRIIAAMLVGAAISVSGASFQGLFKNPIVSPDILGVSSGAGFGAALAIMISASPALVQASAFGFGLAAVGIVYSLSRFFRTGSALSLVLCGIAISALFSAMLSIVKYLADPYDKLPTITYWLMGSLASVTGMDVFFVVIPIITGTAILMLIGWKINVLSMGEEEARSLGIDTKLMQAIIIVCCTMITASAVCISGIIGWIGLVIPHISRMLVGPDYRKLLPATISLGAFFLLLVDDFARSIAAIEVPLGILTALVGAPFFIYLLKKGYGGWS